MTTSTSHSVLPDVGKSPQYGVLSTCRGEQNFGWGNFPKPPKGGEMGKFWENTKKSMIFGQYFCDFPDFQIFFSPKKLDKLKKYTFAFAGPSLFSFWLPHHSK